MNVDRVIYSYLSHPNFQEATEGWKFLWDSEKEFDQQMIDGWKDELNNLLVFVSSSSLRDRGWTDLEIS